MAGFDGDELGEELRFVDVEPAAVGIREAPGADFAGAAMVEDAGIPSGFDAAARSGDAAAGFAGDDDFLDGRVAQVDFVFGSDFGEPERVSWRAANRGDFGVMD